MRVSGEVGDRDGKPAVRLRFDASPPDVLVTREQRIAAGLHHWIDGTMGIARLADRTLAFAPNGARTARHLLIEDGAEDRSGDRGFVTGLEHAEQRILGARERSDHLSGGPALVDPETQSILLLYHGERFTDRDPQDYWSFLGLAVSDDAGRRFEDLGTIVTSSQPERDPGRDRPVEIGPGGFAIHDGWMYVFFLDRGILTTHLNLGVARARLDEVWAAARRRQAPRFHTYLDGAFDQPAIGGRATDLLPGLKQRVLWFDVTRIEELDLLLLVYGTVTGHQGGVTHWTHLARWSHDAVHWSDPVALYPEPVEQEMLYLAMDSGGADPRTITGDRFDLYRVVSTAAFRWDDAQLERLTVRWSAEPGPSAREAGEAIG